MYAPVLACRIPGMGEPGGLPSMGSHRVGHDWSDLEAAAAAIIEHDIMSLRLVFFSWYLKRDTEPNKASKEWSKNIFWKWKRRSDLSLVQFSCSVVSDSLQPHGLQHARLPYPSPTPRVYSNSCPLSQWCHPTISSSVIPFSSFLQSFPASGSFPVSQFASGSRSIGVSASASVLPMSIQDWFPLGWTGWISLQSKGLSRVFSNTTVQKHQFVSTQLSL